MEKLQKLFNFIDHNLLTFVIIGLLLAGLFQSSCHFSLSIGDKKIEVGEKIEKNR